MDNQSGSSRFSALFESALRAYEENTGVTLAEHPLFVQLQSCHSVESMTTLIQSQAQAFGDSQGSDRIMNSIKATVSILTPLSSAASLRDAFGLVRQDVLMAYFTSLTVFRHFHLQKQYRLVSLS
jgi:hypothetical protein